MYDGEQGIYLEPMPGKWDETRVDMVYTEIFHITAVTSVSF